MHPLGADAVGVGVVLAPFVEDAGEQAREVADARQDLRALLALGVAAGDADGVDVGRPQHQLGQEVVVVEAGRIGPERGLRRIELVAVTAGVDAQKLDVALPDRAGDGLGELLVGAGVGALDAGIEVLAGDHVVAGVLGRVGDHAADRVGAVERRSGAADDLDALDVLEVGLLARVGAGAVVGIGEVGHAHAVDHQEHAVAADAADQEVLVAGAERVVADRDAGLVAHQVAHVLHVLAVDVLGGDDRDGGRHVVERAARAGRRRGHGIELRRHRLAGRHDGRGGGAGPLRGGRWRRGVAGGVGRRRRRRRYGRCAVGVCAKVGRAIVPPIAVLASNRQKNRLVVIAS